MVLRRQISFSCSCVVLLWRAVLCALTGVVWRLRIIPCAAALCSHVLCCAVLCLFLLCCLMLSHLARKSTRVV